MIAARVHPFDLIARVLTERLRGFAASEELRCAVACPDVAWERVLGRASTEYVLPAFAAALRELDLTRPLDPELAAFLEAVHAASIERNGELRDELAAAIGALNRAGIEPVLLKGTIRLLDGLYPDDGWRMLRDLDLLVPHARLADANRALQDAGFAPCEVQGEFRRAGGICQIDLHTELFAMPRQVRVLTAAEVLDRARPVAFGDGRVRIPSVEHQLIHLIGHSQIRHLGHAFGRIALRHRLEAAALVYWGHAGVDWQAVLARFSAAGYRRPLLSFLLALRDGAWCAVPFTDDRDPLTALHGRRIALQARSRALAYLGSQIGWWISTVRNQVAERDGSQRKAIRNFISLMSEPGGARRIARAFLMRRRHLMHVLPYICWFMIQ
jgi:Uncharacterised nucleotidyltransferase